jgi:uncharacterized protein (DUF488 family)
LIDVRRYPASRRYPHFNAQPLADALAPASIGYVSIPELGGRRQPRPDSRNTAWRNPSFRGYADYMETAEFAQAVDQVAVMAQSDRVAIMCSEAVWWRCHRGLIADYLKIRGYPVIHLLSTTSHEDHPYTSASRIVDGRLSYGDLFSDG